MANIMDRDGSYAVIDRRRAGSPTLLIGENLQARDSYPDGCSGGQ